MLPRPPLSLLPHSPSLPAEVGGERPLSLVAAPSEGGLGLGGGVAAMVDNVCCSVNAVHAFSSTASTGTDPDLSTSIGADASAGLGGLRGYDSLPADADGHDDGWRSAVGSDNTGTGADRTPSVRLSYTATSREELSDRLREADADYAERRAALDFDGAERARLLAEEYGAQAERLGLTLDELYDEDLTTPSGGYQRPSCRACKGTGSGSLVRWVPCTECLGSGEQVHVTLGGRHA